MADNKNKQAKVIALRSIMKNPKMAKMMEDAFAAPIGSTRRARVKNIVSVVNKLTARTVSGQDGAGGDPMTPRANMSMMAPERNSFANKKIFPPAPAFKEGVMNTGPKFNKTPASGTFDGAGGDGYSWDTTSGYVPNIASNLYQATKDFGTMNQGIGTNIGKGILTGLAGTAAMSEYGQNNAFGNQNLTDTAGAKAIKALWGNNTPTTSTPGAQYPGLTSPYPALNKLGFSSAGQKQNTPLGQMQGAQQQPSSTPKVAEIVDNGNGTYSYTKKDGTLHTGQWGDNFQDTSSAPSGTGTDLNLSGNYSTGDTSGTTNSTGSTMDIGRFGGLMSAISNNVGPNTFAYQTLADKAAFKKLFPGIPDDQIPAGASLERQLGDLKGTLQKEYQLDTLLNNKNNLIKSGATLPGQLEDYIRGRDEYINGVDKMINTVKGDAAGQNILTPDAQARSNKELNYLYTLKGRQNKRYIQFMNSAITEHNADLASVDAQYNTAMTAYQDAFNTQGTIVQGDYNRYYTMLTDLYNQVETAPDKVTSREYAQEQLNAAKLANIDAVTGKTKSAKDIDIYTEMNKYKDYMVDKDGNLLPDVNLTDKIKQVASQNMDPNGVIELAGTGISKGLAATSGSDPFPTISKYKTMISNLKSDLAASGQTGIDISGLEQTLKSQAAAPVADYLKTKSAAIVNAVNDLTGKGWFVKPKTLADKAAFIKNYGAQLGDTNLASSIFDAYEVALKAGGNNNDNVKSLFVGGDPSQLTPDQITSNLASGILATQF